MGRANQSLFLILHYGQNQEIKGIQGRFLFSQA